MKALLCFLFSVGTMFAGDAEDKSKALLADSKRCLAAFQCYHFSALSEDRERTLKLLLVGYVSGQRFLDGWEKGKLLESDRKEVAVAYGFYGTGPTHDFILGRLFQEMKEDLDREIKDVRREMWDMVVRSELQSRNADLILDSFRPDPSVQVDPFWKKYESDLAKGIKALGQGAGKEGKN